MMKIKNFKGIAQMELSLEGKQVISGPNGAGKTSVYDAYVWALYGKDSQGRAAFRAIRDGAERAVVEVVRGGKHFRREHYAHYKKTRGRAEKEFSGWKTEFFLDDVPCRKKDYDGAVAEVFGPEDRFRLVTDVNYFGSLKTAERRKILSEITDMDVRPAVPDGLNMGDKTPEDYLKMLKARVGKLNKELDQLPARIDEASKGIIPGARSKIEALQKEVLELDKELERAKEAVTDDGHKKEIARLSLEVSEAQAEMMREQSRIDEEIRKAEHEERIKKQVADHLNEERKDSLRGHIEQARQLLLQAENNADACRSQAERAEDKAENKAQRVLDLRQMFRDTSAKDIARVCYACGQEITSEQAEQAEAKKKVELDKIRAEGKSLNSEIAELKARAEKAREELNEYETNAEAHRQKVANLETDLKRVEAETYQQDPETQKNIDRLRERRENISAVARYNEAVRALENAKQSAPKRDDSEVRRLNSEIADKRDEIAGLRQSEKAKERVRELEVEKQNAQEAHDEASHQVRLTEDYIRECARMVEEAVSGLFSRVKFQLFEEQVNGGLKDTCLILWDGVSYDTNLNTGARINAGLDIVSTMQEIYGSAPVFVDNYEALTEVDPDLKMPESAVLLEQVRDGKKLKVSEV